MHEKFLQERHLCFDLRTPQNEEERVFGLERNRKTVDLLGDPQRVIERGQGHCGADPQPLRARPTPVHKWGSM